MSTIPAIGANSTLTFQLENIYGVDPTTPVGTKIPVLTGSGISGSQPLIDNMLLSSDPNYRDSILGKKDANGNIHTYVMLDSMPHFVKLALGSLASVGSTPNFTHTGKITSGVLPSWTVEENLALSAGPQYLKSNGVVSDQVKFSAAVDGFFVQELTMLGAKTAMSGTPLFGAPTDKTLDTPAHHMMIGSTDIKLGGSSFDGLVSFDVVVNHNVDKNDYRIGSTGTRASAPRARSKVTGTMKAMFTDLVFYNYLVAGNAVAFECKWTFGPNQSVRILAPRVFFDRKDPILDSEGPISLTANFIAAKDATANTSLQIDVANQAAGSGY